MAEDDDCVIVCVGIVLLDGLIGIGSLMTGDNDGLPVLLTLLILRLGG